VRVGGINLLRREWDTVFAFGMREQLFVSDGNGLYSYSR
jgi:hypothetical protein